MMRILVCLLVALTLIAEAHASAPPQTATYTYTPADALTSVTYPSGRTVAYTRDAVGRITAVSTNGSNLLTGRMYRADGLVNTQAWGNGLSETKAHDLQGRLTGWAVSGRLNRTYAHDANGNVVQKDLAQFQYDPGPLDRGARPELYLPTRQ